jgi:hypothetical protein
MSIPKRYFHDKLILLLLSINSFLVLLTSILLLLRLDFGKSSGLIVQYRSNLGLSAYKAGSSLELISFIIFAIAVFVLHLLLSIRVYHPRRYMALMVLSLEVLLLAITLVVSNALLSLR